MIIIGAGLSGLLCGALNHGSVIYESGPKRESDHKALFRCKKPDIGKVLGIPFKKVSVSKGIWFQGEEVEPSIRIAHMYSRKVTGKVTGRSILDLSPGIRYIPPDDFAKRLQDRCKINWNTKWSAPFLNKRPIVSTIPMQHMAEMIGVNIDDFFGFRPIYANQIHIKNCDSYCTMYYPDPEMNTYRASITGDILITEGVGELSQKELYAICDSLGINFTRQMMNNVVNYKQRLGKITPINNRIREEFITRMTIGHGIYSLGRFATWRPKVMLDDVLEDIYHIRRLIEGGKYCALNHKQNEDN